MLDSGGALKVGLEEWLIDTSDKISGMLPMNITINTVMLVAHEIIYRNRQIGGTLALAQVRRKLYNQMIKEHLLVKFSSDQQNFHIKWDSIEDDLISYKFPTD